MQSKLIVERAQRALLLLAHWAKFKFGIISPLEKEYLTGHCGVACRDVFSMAALITGTLKKIAIVTDSFV